jgi:hypothetical protein
MLLKPIVEEWRPEGRIFFWRCPERESDLPGWCMTADFEGLTALLDLCDRIELSGWSPEVRFAVTPSPPSRQEAGAPSGTPAEYGGPETLGLRLLREPSREAHWALEFRGSHVSLCMGASAWERFRDGMVEIANGADNVPVSSGKDGFCLRRMPA